MDVGAGEFTGEEEVRRKVRSEEAGLRVSGARTKLEMPI